MDNSENATKLYSSFLKLVCVLMSSFFIEIVNKNFNNEFFSIFSNVFHLIGGSYLTANLMSTPILEFQKSVIPFLPKIFRTNRRLEECIYNYQKIKKYIKNENNLETLDKLFVSAEIYSVKDKQANEEITFDGMLDKINYILTLYEPIPETKFNIQDIINNFEKIEFDKNTKNELIKHVIIPFISKINNSIDNISLNPIYLLGGPGTGKTKFVKDLSKILGIPIINGSFDSFKYDPHYQPKFEPNAVHMYIKALHQAIKTRKSKSFILFIDEFDKQLERRSNLLTYLNSNNNIVVDEYLQISADVGNILFICSGNKAISQVHKCHAPLDNRFIKIMFPKIPTSLKKKIIYKNIENYKGRINYTEIDKIIESDKFHGIRQLLMDVNTNISNQLGKYLFKGTKWENINNHETKSNAKVKEESESESESESVSELESKFRPKSRKIRGNLRSKSPSY